jgi:hypothetical protein
MMGLMTAYDRPYERAVRRATTLLAEIGREARDARLMSGSSQACVATSTRMSHSTVSRFERGLLPHLTIVDAIVLADAVGLDLSIRTYPGRQPTRDAGHGRRLSRFLSHTSPTLQKRTEVLLPALANGTRERRAWDATIADQSGVTGVELEQRLYDVQAQTRRVLLKWRDSGADDLLLIVANTVTNRRVLKEFAEYFSDLPRQRTAAVLADLSDGRRPRTGLILF